MTIPGRVHILIDRKANLNAKQSSGFKLTLKRCLLRGCVAITTLNHTMRAQMRAGKTGQLQFIRASGQKVELPLSWIGFTQAMKALDKKG